MMKPVDDDVIEDLIHRTGKIVERRNLSGRIMVAASPLNRLMIELKQYRERAKIGRKTERQQ